ncbi:penicillin-binding protein 1B [Veronia pacifica]|uniref:Penicillin-binding protein 1B n=1 Tax=Veronia pacifica TaxID=1080227 RepID=A0A1C3EIV5_9GAMM|nr:penicillin-binding protein 1B [Veronia pacifica]ODA33172.1 penicillin-binding protein 1B [Veronia pacifica]
MVIKIKNAATEKPKQGKTKTPAKKKSSTTRKSPAKKSSNKKNNQQKKNWFRWTAVLGLKLGLCCVAVMALFGIYLDSKIQSRFEGQIWSLPAVVYGRVLHLEPGDNQDIQGLKQELELLNYQRVRQPEKAGQYAASSTKIEIIRRPFEFEDGSDPSRHVMISFDQQGVKKLKDMDSGKQLGFLNIEPRLLGMMNPRGDEQRLFVPREGFPEYLVDALLTTEDRDFYHHGGVSPIAIARAFVANLRSGRTVQGGSTLTQQLAKNIFLTRERSLWRKVQEAYMAVILDYRYSKDKILETYLNEVYLGQAAGNAVHGFPLGARLYFGRPINELSLDQLAMLVGMVKGPSYYNPRRYPERARQRRDLVLRLMMEQNLISGAQYEQAASRKLGIEKDVGLTQRQPAYFELLRQEIKERVGGQFTPGTGLRVFTTLDPLSQQLIEKAVVDTVGSLKKRAGKKLEAAAVIADRSSGEIRAVVGGSRPGYAGFNRALNGSRQIGSLAKPPIYLAALSQPDKYNLMSPLDDNPLSLNSNGTQWQPRNYDRKYRGQVPLITALEKSYNIPTVNLGLDLGLNNVVDTMADLGIDPDQITRVPSLLLGAFTLTPMEVTQMYQTLASGGRKASLTALRSVVTQQGDVLYRQWPKSSQVVPAQASWLTLFAMKKVVASGTARRLNHEFSWASLAGKTGTTDNNRDSWYVGIDGREVVTVWLGRDDNKPTGLTGSSGALPVYQNYIKRRQPQPLLLPWPSQLTSVSYHRQATSFVPDCKSKTTLPVWDRDGKWKSYCQGGPVGWLERLFNG